MNPADGTLRRERRKFLEAYKRLKGCIDCGLTDGKRLDFDHRDKATKRFKIGANVSMGWDSLLAEIEKCDVRCASCHTKRHHRDEPGFAWKNRARVSGGAA